MALLLAGMMMGLSVAMFITIGSDRYLYAAIAWCIVALLWLTAFIFKSLEER